jgi:hypothetical protein
MWGGRVLARQPPALCAADAAVANLGASCGTAGAASVCYRTLATRRCLGDAFQASGASRCSLCALLYGRTAGGLPPFLPHERAVAQDPPLARKSLTATATLPRVPRS